SMAVGIICAGPPGKSSICNLEEEAGKLTAEPVIKQRPSGNSAAGRGPCSGKALFLRQRDSFPSCNDTIAASCVSGGLHKQHKPTSPERQMRLVREAYEPG